MHRCQNGINKLHAICEKRTKGFVVLASIPGSSTTKYISTEQTDIQQASSTCLTLVIFPMSSSAEIPPAMTSSGIPLSPMKKLDGTHTTGSTGSHLVKEKSHNGCCRYSMYKIMPEKLLIYQCCQK